MTKATHSRASAASRREIRKLTAGQNAREAVGALEPGCEVYGLTKGQFSLIDLIEALLEQTGPADVQVATGTAARAEIKRADALLRNGNIRRIRFLVDRSFPTRQPEYCAALRATFGDDVIRVTRTHAKFVLIRNERWALVVRTSMNLNTNPRIENFEISDDRAMHDFMAALVDEVYDQGPEYTEDGFAALSEALDLEPKPMDAAVTHRDFPGGTLRLDQLV